MLTAIRQWVIKTMMKGNTGVVQSLPKQEIIEMNVQITAQRLMQNGINPNDLKTVGQVENVVNQIEQPKVNVNPGMTSVKKADVLDMEGNKIPEGSRIMGGKEVPTSIDQESFLQRVKKAVDEDREAALKAKFDKSNEEGIASMKNKLDDPEEKADGGRIGLLAGSTKIPAVISALLKNKKKVNQAVNNIFPTGDYKLDAEMVAESIVELNPKPFNNMLYDDLDDVTRSEIYGAALSGVNQQNALMLQMKKATRPEKTLQSMKEGKGINMSDPDIADEFARFMKETDPKGTKELEQKLQLENFKTKDRKGNADGGRIGLEGGTNEDFQKYLKERERFEKERSLEQLFKEYQEDLRRQEVGEQKQMAADGGRIGLKAGMTKRAFLKLMGAGVAGIGAVKSGILGLGKGATKQAAKEVAQQTTSGTPPPYFFKLAEKIKKMGTDVTKAIAYKDKQKITKFKDYELTEDLTTGEQTIQRMKTLDDGSEAYYGNPLVEETYMSYKPGKGQMDETMKGKTPPDDYEEGTALIRSDREYAGEVVDEMSGISDDIFEEVGEEVPEAIRKEKASGGLAYMLGE